MRWEKYNMSTVFVQTIMQTRGPVGGLLLYRKDVWGILTEERHRLVGMMYGGF
jgi:hypothetical protein